MIKLRKELFWDVPFSKLDWQKDAAFIIKRVLFYGDLKDYHLLKKHYSGEKIKKVAERVNYPNKKSASFWKLVFNFSSNARKSP